MKQAMDYDIRDKTVWVAGHTGMVGSSIVRRLAEEPVSDIVVARSTEVDLRRQVEAERFLSRTRPDVAILAAAVVGGINANRRAHGRFLYDNLMIAANSIEACRVNEVEKVIVLGSSCIYPRECAQPIREEYFLDGPLEETNEGYAIAKIAGLELGKMYRRQYGMNVVSLMPTNLYGPGDNYDLETSHVLPALLRKVHEAKIEQSDKIEIWGTGRPRREFLYVDDLSDAVLHVLKVYSGEQHLNVGTGVDISIADLARLIGDVVGWEGGFHFNNAMPDGTMVKRLDVSRIQSTGWKHRVGLREGIERTYEHYLEMSVAPTRLS